MVDICWNFPDPYFLYQLQNVGFTLLNLIFYVKFTDLDDHADVMHLKRHVMRLEMMHTLFVLPSQCRAIIRKGSLPQADCCIAAGPQTCSP